MERLALSCGGYAVNSVEDLSLDCLGEAGRVYEVSLGDDSAFGAAALLQALHIFFFLPRRSPAAAPPLASFFF